MTTSNNAALDAYLDNQLMQHLKHLDAEDMQQDFYDEIENDLLTTGLDLDGEILGRGDVDPAWGESLAYSEWMAEYGTADSARRKEMNDSYAETKAAWVHEHYVPHLAEELKKAHDVDCFGWEDVA